MWWKYFPLAVMPSTIATFATWIWFIVSPYLKVSTDAEVFNSVIAIVAIAHSFIASMQINQGYKQKQKIEISFFLKDARMFKENACIRINPAIMCLLFIFSVILFVLFCFYPIKDTEAGLVCVWLAVFTLYMFWKVAQELFNPYEGVDKISRQRVTETFGEEVYSDTLQYFEALKEQRIIFSLKN